MVAYGHSHTRSSRYDQRECTLSLSLPCTIENSRPTFVVTMTLDDGEAARRPCSVGCGAAGHQTVPERQYLLTRCCLLEAVESRAVCARALRSALSRYSAPAPRVRDRPAAAPACERLAATSQLSHRTRLGGPRPAAGGTPPRRRMVGPHSGQYVRVRHGRRQTPIHPNTRVRRRVCQASAELPGE